MNKFTQSLTLMQACIDVKDNIQDCSYAMNRLMSYMMDNFTNPLTYQDPNNCYVSDGRFNGSNELVLETREILRSGESFNQYRPPEFNNSPWTNEQWLTLLNHIPPAFTEPVFIIAILKYLLAREKVNCDISLINHDGTFTEFHNRYGRLISLACSF
jgi:hypothetical protein